MIWIELIASLLVGLGTVVGALPVLFTSTITQQAEGILLGFGHPNYYSAGRRNSAGVWGRGHA